MIEATGSSQSMASASIVIGGFSGLGGLRDHVLDVRRISL
jgi:hypothetical protein